MRVRAFGLRLLAALIAVAWLVIAGLVLVGYAPGGPLDRWAGVALLAPAGLALVALRWPPVASGDRAYPAMVWLGLGTLLLMVPSIVGTVDQLTSGGPQTLLPSLESAYPWILALVGTGLFSGFGLARRRLGPGASRRRRFGRGLVVGTVAAVVAGSLFAGVAIGNELAIRDQPIQGSRYGPSGPATEPPACDGPISVGPSARLDLTLDAEVDRRPIGRLTIKGVRNGAEFRWAGYVAGDRAIGNFAAARVAGQGWVRDVDQRWTRVDAARVRSATLDSQVLAVALLAPGRSAPEVRGVSVLEGARARQCRIQIDGETFGAAFPEVRWLIGDGDLSRWRGQLDYWVFLDGQLGLVDVVLDGDALGIGQDGLQGRIRAVLSATHRDQRSPVQPPG